MRSFAQNVNLFLEGFTKRLVDDGLKNVKFEDFMNIIIEDRFKSLTQEFKLCVCKNELTDDLKASDNLQELFDKFMNDEQERDIASYVLWNTL